MHESIEQASAIPKRFGLGSVVWGRWAEIAIRGGLFEALFGWAIALRTFEESIQAEAARVETEPVSRCP